VRGTGYGMHMTDQHGTVYVADIYDGTFGWAANLGAGGHREVRIG